MRIRNIITCILLAWLGTGISTLADNPKRVLDKTSNLLKGSGGIQATFEATVFKGVQEKGTTEGTIHVQGNKFKIVSSQMTTWFDGKTQWSHIPGSGETYVSTPTEAELQSINPYTFINLYKNGYSYAMSETIYNGRACYEVKLIARKKQAGIQEMRIVIDKASYLPYSVRIKPSNGNWLRIRVRNVKTGKAWNASFFQFNKTEHPDVELIDLR